MAKQFWKDDVSEAFREIYVDPNSGYFTPFDDVKPALEFGWNHALANEFPNENWEQVEADLERIWHKKHQSHGTWPEMKRHVRHAWEKARGNWKGLAGKA